LRVEEFHCTDRHDQPLFSPNRRLAGFRPRYHQKRVSVCGVPSGKRLEFGWCSLQQHEVIVSGGEVNRLIDDPCSERLPSIDFAHVDLTGREQRPKQHGGSFR